MHIDVHAHAAADIEALWHANPPAAASVVATLEQLGADPRLIDKLTTHGNNQIGAQEINVKRWQRIRAKQGDLWRFRALNTSATSYRVIYGYQIQTRQICVLGVVHKDEFDYDNPSNLLAQRIVDDWRAL